MAIQTVEELVKLNRKDLLQLQKNVAAAVIQSEKNARAEAIRKMEEVAESFGFSSSELYGGKDGKRARTPSAPKFRHPENPEITWSGQGRKPKWVSEHIGNGGALDDLAI